MKINVPIAYADVVDSQGEQWSKQCLASCAGEELCIFVHTDFDYSKPSIGIARRLWVEQEGTQLMAKVYLHPDVIVDMTRAVFRIGGRILEMTHSNNSRVVERVEVLTLGLIPKADDVYPAS